MSSDTELAALVRERAGSTPMPLSDLDDWCELTAQEAAVFSIHPAEFRIMVETFHCFEAFIGRAEGTDYDTRHEDLLNAAREARPDLLNADGLSEFDVFANFARGLGLLTARQAYKMHLKQQAWLLRCSLLIFADENEDSSCNP